MNDPRMTATVDFRFIDDWPPPPGSVHTRAVIGLYRRAPTIACPDAPVGYEVQSDVPHDMVGEAGAFLARMLVEWAPSPLTEGWIRVLQDVCYPGWDIVTAAADVAERRRG